MKKKLSLLLAGILAISLMAGCAENTAGSGGTTTAGGDDAAASGKPVSLTVVTTYGGDDGGRIPYETAYKAWEKATGNTIQDASGTADETFKAKVLSDFETGAEPDVLFYFNGADADKIVGGGKVVSIADIQAKYGNYADNHNIDLIPASPVDGVKYAIPSYGYWELMFVNKVVLADCGLEVPTETTTWDEFLSMCQVIKDKNYTPIAVSIHEVPHYWFEYVVMNNGNVKDHCSIPASSTDTIGQNWVKGLNDIKDLFEKGFFPANTTTATDAETFQLLYDNKAAFAIDGSWKTGNVEEASGHPDDFTTSFVPGKNLRKASDNIAGLSSGWYITAKAWNDPEKQAAAVDFVRTMTSDETIASFGAAGATVSLKSGPITPENPSQLRKDSIATLSKATASVAACQDLLTQTQREALFADIKNIAAGTKTAEQAIDDALALG